MTPAFQDPQIRQYLLGDLAAADETVLEAACFRDADLLARVELLRADLADDYAAARLSAADRAKFERRVLATEEGREQLAMARALRRAAGVGARDIRAWRIDRRWLGLAAAAPLAFGAWFAWRAVTVHEPSTAPPTAPVSTSPPGVVARDPGTTPPDQPRTAPPIQPAVALATLILTADLERSGGQPPTLLTGSGATHVELVVPRADVAGPAPRGRVESVEGTPVWTGAMIVPAGDAADSRPRARVPVSALPPGDYLFSMVAPRLADDTGAPRYYFRVRAR